MSDPLASSANRPVPSVSHHYLVDGGAELTISPEEAAALLHVGPSALRTLGVSVVVKSTGGDRLQSTFAVKSTNIVGASRFSSHSHMAEIVVGPKIGNANLLKMMDYIGEGIAPTDHDVTLAARRGEPVALVIEYVAREIRRFLEGPSYRDYIRVENGAARQPRGRVDMRKLLTDNWPRMGWHTLPCAYFDFTRNVPENQVLAAAIEAASRLSLLLPPSVRERVRDHVFHARRHLTGVAPPRKTENVLGSITYNRQNERFKRIHRLCALLLDRSTVALNEAAPISFCTFAIDMARLFERYVWRLFQSAFGKDAVPAREDLVFSLGGTAHQIKLDGMHLGSVRRVIECKYRIVENAGTLSFDEGEVPNAHLFQGVAYAMHEGVRADEVLIVYPAVNLNRPCEIALRVSGFRSLSGPPLSVNVLLVSLAHPVLATVESLRQTLRP